jgi:hypothetical protein
VQTRVSLLLVIKVNSVNFFLLLSVSCEDYGTCLKHVPRFYLTTSVLAFQTYSNKHSVVKLTSRLLTVEDTRPASGNSFPLVVTHRDSFQPESLQVEVCTNAFHFPVIFHVDHCLHNLESSECCFPFRGVWLMAR